MVKYLLSLGADPRINDGFVYLCAPEEIQKLLNQELVKEKYWSDTTRFKKYGDRFCSEFDYDNLQYAGNSKLLMNRFLTIFLTIILKYIYV